VTHEAGEYRGHVDWFHTAHESDRVAHSGMHGVYGRAFFDSTHDYAHAEQLAAEEVTAQDHNLGGGELVRDQGPTSSGRVLTSSELTTFLRCRRKWWLNYYRRLTPRRQFNYLPGVGTFVHAGLEVYYRDGSDPIERVQINANRSMVADPDAAEEIADAAGLAAIMLEGYLDWVAETGADVGLLHAEAEKKVEVQLTGTPYRLRGKIDAQVTRESDGALVQLEHKTVGNLTDLPKTAQQAFQFLTYDLLAFLKSMEGNGTRTDGVILNMLRRVKRTASAKPPFYGRHEVWHNTHELRAHWQHVVAIAQESDRVRARLDAGEDHHTVVPPTIDRSCSWSCDFAAVCPMFDDGSDAEGLLSVDFQEHDPLERYEEGAE
jgi:hypothetical protein